MATQESFVKQMQDDIKKRSWERVYESALEEGLTPEQAKKEADELWSMAESSVIYDTLFPDGE